jgi:ribonucleoside-diphosphate reductase alpha chain
MTARTRLPNRRGSETFDLVANGLRFTVSASRFADGELGEVFITNHKAGSSAGIMASDAAIAASLAMQYGCPAEVLRRALSRDSQGRATSPLGLALDLIAGNDPPLKPAA